MFVIRESLDIEKDLSRNWSSFCGGGADGPICGETEAEAIAQWCEWTDQPAEDAPEMRFHNGIQGWCEYHYDGLGAWEMEAETEEEAIAEATGQSGLASTMEEGSGHFFAEQVKKWHRVGDNIYIIELKP